MDASKLLDAMMTTLGANLPGLLGALLILILGWLLAFVVRAGVRKLLGMAKLNERVSAGTEKRIDLEGGIAKGVYYVLVILVFIAFFDKLNLELVAGPLRTLADEVFAYAPKLVAGLVLILVAWILATILRSVSTKLLGKTKMDETLSREAGMRPISQNVGNILYWLVFLLFLPAILSAFGVQGLLEPVEGMVGQLLGFVPNLFAAVIIALVGRFVARLLRDLTQNILATTGADTYGEKMGLRETMKLSRLVGLVVYVVVIVPVVIAALDALRIEAVSEPATRMIDTMLQAVPNIIAAAVIVGISYFVLRLLADLVTRLLGGMGFDRLPSKIGFGEGFLTRPTASEVVGRLVIFFGMLFAIVEAAHRLGFERVSDLMTIFIEFGGQVLLGLAIIGIGLWIANVAAGSIRRAGGATATLWSALARIAILGLVLAMGLRAMGLADEIVNLAFGLTVGAVCVAFALAFGLGGREAAGRQMDEWFRKLKGS